MLWIKAFHIILVVTWFSGLFYLPRLFVYHAMSDDKASKERFKIMEHKLYFYITWPSAILTTVFGFWLLSLHYHYYAQQIWMHIKLSLVLLLWIYHFICWKYLNDFKNDKNKHSHFFYRWFNEFPTILLIAIIILTVVQP